MEATSRVLNELEQAEVMSRYAVRGAMAATFYVEPLLTRPSTLMGFSRTVESMAALSPEVARLLAAKEQRRRKLSGLPFLEKVCAVAEEGR